MESLSLSEKLFYNSVRLTSRLHGADTGSGTGFFYSFSHSDGTQKIAILTNKHVIEGSDSIGAICNTANHGAASINLTLSHNNLISHPDQNVDLCAILIDEILTIAASNGMEILFCVMSTENIPAPDMWQNFDAIEDVTMLGCPNGLFDSFNNMPIARNGITASHLAKQYNGRNEFVVDMACFPGSSGSPIFIYDRNGYFDKKTNTHMACGRFFFIGILYAGPMIDSTGEITLSTQLGFKVSNMMHLGYAIKSDEIHAIETELFARMQF